MSLYDDVLPASTTLNPEVELTLTKHWLCGAATSGIELDFHKPQSVSTRDECRTKLEHMILGIASKYKPDETITTSIGPSGDLYRAKSALQKAIRKGDVKFAQMAAHAMLTSPDPAQYWRRISMIALEDIGLADPYAAAAALVLASNTKLRSAIGLKKAGFWIAAVLAHTKKSRDLTHMMVYQQVALRQQAVDFSWPAYSEADAIGTTLNETLPLKTRLSAFSALSAGSHSEDLFGLKTSTLDKNNRTQVMDDMELPPLIRFLMVQGRRNGAWCLDLAIPFVWRQLCSSKYATVLKDPYDLPGDFAKIGSTHAGALDQYTLLGKRAIGYFKKSCQPVAKLLEDVHQKVHTAVMGEAVFYAEGGILRPWLAWDSSVELFDMLFEAWFQSQGMTKALALELILTVQANLPDLNAIRTKFLAQ